MKYGSRMIKIASSISKKFLYSCNTYGSSTFCKQNSDSLFLCKLWFHVFISIYTCQFHIYIYTWMVVWILSRTCPMVDFNDGVLFATWGNELEEFKPENVYNFCLYFYGKVHFDYHYSYIPLFLYTFIPIYHYSYIPLFLYTFIPIYHYSYIPLFLYRGGSCASDIYFVLVGISLTHI